MLERSVIRRLRAGVVPGAALEMLSVGYTPIASVVAQHVDELRAGGNLAPLFVRGEWGAGKSHFLTFARFIALKRGVASSTVALNARSAPLNYPQRFYPLVVSALECDEEERGLRALLSRWLRDAETRRRLNDFSSSTRAGDLGSPLRTLERIHEHGVPPVHDGEWAWTELLGGDLSWADYPYKRAQAIDRIQTLALMLRALGFGGLILAFDELETIDQLWSIRSRLVAYDVLGRLISMQGLWCLFAITDRFRRAVDDDLNRGIADWPNTSDKARRFLQSWRRTAFETLEPPSIDRQLGRILTRRVTDLYCAAHPAAQIDGGFVTSCVETWAPNPSRDPRRLIRLAVHRLDLLQMGDFLANETGPVSSFGREDNPLRSTRMTPDHAKEEFDQLVRAVPDLSGREPNKFSVLKTWVSGLVEVPAEKISVKYLGTPNNLKNRLTESGGQSPELTLALSAPGEVDGVIRNARLLVGEGKPLKVVAVATQVEDQRWAIVWIIDTAVGRLANRLRLFFPTIKID